MQDEISEDRLSLNCPHASILSTEGTTPLPEPIAYLGGNWIPQSELKISVEDAGFMLGTTVAEQLRTFAGRVFRLEQHLERLRRCLEILEIGPTPDDDELTSIVLEIVDRNFPALPQGDDLGVTLFITPGSIATAGTPQQTPLVGIHTKPVPFKQFAAHYEHGQTLVVPETRQTGVECWPRELKVRSRAHYYLADLQARKVEPGSRAVMLDQSGYVMEATTANIAMVREGEGLIMPPRELVLPGISIQALRELAEAEGIPYREENLLPTAYQSADEVLLTSTSPCIIPCTRWDGQPIGTGKPGPIFDRLMTAWGERVGIDIRAQARQFAQR